jgi:predicted Holliday junction resolvase-like endonuclease
MNNQVIQVYSFYRKIFCACKCGEVFRLSDSPPFDQNISPPRDWLETLTEKDERIQHKIDRMDEAWERDRSKVIMKERRAAESDCNRRAEGVLPGFRKLNFNSRDIRHVGSPVAFLSFDGLSNRDVTGIRLLTGAPRSVEQENVLESLKLAIRSGNVQWSTTRVQENGTLLRNSSEPKC